MSGQDIVRGISWRYPGVDWGGYQGDGSSLDAHTATNGDPCSGLRWQHPSAPRPTLADLAQWAQSATDATAKARNYLGKRLAVAATVEDLKAVLKDALRL